MSFIGTLALAMGFVLGFGHQPVRRCCNSRFARPIRPSELAGRIGSRDQLVGDWCGHWFVCN